MTIEFEKLLTPASLQIIRDTALVVWPATFAEILSPEQISYMMKMMYSPEVMADELASGYNFEIVKINCLPSGYFSWSAYSEQPGTAKLHKLYLMHKFHGQGIGSAMLQQVEAEMKAAGFSKIRLNVNKYNLRAKKAYDRNGFHIAEAVKIDICDGFFMDDFVMEKNL